MNAATSSRLHPIGPPTSILDYLRQTWDRRDLAWQLPSSELRARNQNAVFGSFWHVLHPLLLAGIYYLIFGVIFSGRGGIDNFVGFLVVGLFAFFYTQKAVVSGSRAIIGNEGLIQNIAFPRAILVLAVVVRETISQAPAILVMFVIVLISGGPPQVTWFLIVPIVAVQIIFNLGAAFIAARLTFHFRDFDQLLPYLFRMLLYLSGIFFTLERIPAGWPRMLIAANPLYSFIELTREAILHGTTSARLWAEVVTWSLALLILGFFFFRAREHDYSHV